MQCASEGSRFCLDVAKPGQAGGDEWLISQKGSCDGCLMRVIRLTTFSQRFQLVKFSQIKSNFNRLKNVALVGTPALLTNPYSF
jgi:hypothetical protein